VSRAGYLCSVTLTFGSASELTTGASGLSLPLTVGIEARSGGQSSLLQGGGDNVLGKSQIFTKVSDTLSGQIPIVMAPVKGLLDETLGGERLKEHHDLDIGDRDGLRVLSGVEILLGHHNTLCD